MIEEYKQCPVHEPGALLQLDQKGRKGVGINHILQAQGGPDLSIRQRLSQICCRQSCKSWAVCQSPAGTSQAGGSCPLVHKPQWA